MSVKRQHAELDPDYEDVSEIQSKKRRVFEEGAKHATKRRIEAILEKQFDTEIANKESELLNASEGLEMAKSVMDRLRACIVADYFGKASQHKTSQSSNQAPVIHPAVHKYIGKAPVGSAQENVSSIKKEVTQECGQMTSTAIHKTVTKSAREDACVAREEDGRTGRHTVKRRVIIGNVSRSIPSDQRDENDQATHKWMLYVRGTKENPQISDFVKKVWFFLHPSYRPNDLVEVSEPPFHLTRRGWGEFPVRVQLHFKDERKKRLDIIHNLKLDRTYTGLQTLGSETVVDVEIEEVPPDIHSLSAIKQEPMEDSDTEERVITSDITSPVSNHDTCVGNTENTDLPTGGTNVRTLLQFASPAVMDKNMAISRTFGCVQSSVKPAVISTNCQTILVTTPPLPQVLNQPGVKVSSAGQPASISLLTSNLGLVPTAVNGVLNHVNSVSIGDKNKSGAQMTSPKAAGGSPVKNAGQKQLIVTPNKGVVTNSVRLPNNQQQNTRPVNQSVNSNIYFVKYVDNQGKTILIPHQMCSGIQITGDKNSNPGAIKGRAQPVIPVLNFSNTAASLISPPKVIQSPASMVRATNSKTVLDTTKQVQPVIIKQETGPSSSVTNIILPIDKNVRPLTPGQSSASMTLIGSFLPRQAVSTVKCGTVASPRSQLKVTSQGLIQVQNTNGTGSLQRPNKDGCVLKPVSNQQITIQAQPQIILQPNGNKILKGKSLLSNLTLSTCDKSFLTVNQSGEAVVSSVCNRAHTVVTSAQPIKFSTQAGVTSRQVKPANHFLVVPVSQQATVSSTEAKLVNNSHTTLSNSVNSGKLLLDMKSPDKKMLIVVQNDLSKNSQGTVNSTSTTSHPVNSVASLLVPKSQSNTVNCVKSSASERPVVISSIDQKKKQVILVQDSLPREMKPPLPVEKEKKIIVVDPKRKKPKPPAELTTIKSLCVKDYQDLPTLIRAAVIRHPVVSETCGGGFLHPYCAKSEDEWLAWNIGKRRASEWQRASTVRRFLVPYLDSEGTFQGENMWTVKQILTWCRRHAYSPHYQEQPLHPTSIDVQSDPGLHSSKDNSVYSSLTSSRSVMEEAESLQDGHAPNDSSDEEIEIVGDCPNLKQKQVKQEVTEDDFIPEGECMPPFDGELFVNKISEQIGIQFQPTEVMEDTHGSVTQGVLYKVMERFMGDLLRETFALQVNSGRYPDMLTVKDIFAAVKCLPFTDFLSNRYCGMEDGTDNIKTSR